MTTSTVQHAPHCTVAWLLAPWLGDLDINESLMLSGMTLDSRKVAENYLFVALQGAICDGRDFIDAALRAGATAVLCETTDKQQHGQVELKAGKSIIYFYRLPYSLNAIALRFYFPLSNTHQLTAVTGTNGKTTIASLLTNCYQLLGKQSAQMGTIGNGLYGKLKASLNTTLDAVSVCRELADYQRQGAQHTVMEVSSHGLMQGRIAALPFHSAIFTNLTRDHLDYHGTMQAYADAKKRLFDDFPVQHKIINVDDGVGRSWIDEYPDAVAYGFSANADMSTRYFKITNVDYLPKGIQFEFVSSWGEGRISAPFYGDFNVLNIAAVCCSLLCEDFSLSSVIDSIAKLTVVPGRMEQYFFANSKVTFIVDYAHTPDALKNALAALQCHKKQGRIIAMFGCGGDRDKGKRPEMAMIAEQYADNLVIVDDNPRSEDATLIVQDIKAGLSEPQNAMVIHDRKQALVHLLSHAQAEDIILVAGKGHEDYQIIGETKIDYSDRACLSQLMTMDSTEIEQIMQDYK